MNSAADSLFASLILWSTKSYGTRCGLRFWFESTNYSHQKIVVEIGHNEDIYKYIYWLRSSSLKGQSEVNPSLYYNMAVCENALEFEEELFIFQTNLKYIISGKLFTSFSPNVHPLWIFSLAHTLCVFFANASISGVIFSSRLISCESNGCGLNPFDCW